MITLRQRQKMIGTCVTPQLITKESNRRANERKKEEWQAKGNVIRLVDEKRIQKGLFTAKANSRRQNWMASMNTGPRVVLGSIFFDPTQRQPKPPPEWPINPTQPITKEKLGPATQPSPLQLHGYTYRVGQKNWTVLEVCDSRICLHRIALYIPNCSVFYLE